MTTPRSAGIGLLAVLLVAAVVSSVAVGKKPGSDPAPPAPIEYTVFWLGGLVDDASSANDVNSAGTIVGQACDVDGICRAVCWRLENVWEPEDLNELVPDPDGGYFMRAECTNNNGLIAGCFEDAQGIVRLAVCDPVPDAPEESQLWVLTETDAPISIRDMNSDGTVVGYLRNEAGVTQGYAWRPGGPLILLPERHFASGINDHNVIVGIIAGPKGPEGEVFKWQLDWDNIEDPPIVERLGASARLLGAYSGRPAISNNGTIAGTVAVRKKREPRRLVPPPEGAGDWELLADDKNYWWVGVSDINDKGQICGILNLNKPDGFDPGFVYDASRGQFWQLDDRIVHDPSGLWTQPVEDIFILTGVADESPLTSYGGFSMVVGRGGGQSSFVLIPGPRPE